MDVGKMSKKDEQLLNDVENRMAVEKLLDNAKARRYTQVVVVGVVDDNIETAHYTDLGGVIALGLIELAKESMIRGMKESDDGPEEKD